jgi:hypothetical protein
MPKFLEDKLKKEYGPNSKTPYKVMNKLGVMKGNKETTKGHQWDIKHEVDEATSPSNRFKKAIRKKR